MRRIGARDWCNIKAILVFADDRRTAWAEYCAALIVAMLSDEHGNRLLTDDDVDKQADIDPAVFSELVERAQELMTPDSIEDEKKS